MKDKIKQIKDLDFKKVDFSKEWTWGRGGHGLDDYDYHISYIKQDLSAEIYVLPECISTMLKLSYERGMDRKLKDIKDALGVGNRDQ